MKYSGNEVFNIEDELSKLPHKPGVYIMHDENEQILYVGKAVDLQTEFANIFVLVTDTTIHLRFLKWYLRYPISNTL